MREFSSALGSCAVPVLFAGMGGREAEVASATAEMGSLVCSIVVAMPRRKT